MVNVAVLRKGYLVCVVSVPPRARAVLGACGQTLSHLPHATSVRARARTDGALLRWLARQCRSAAVGGTGCRYWRLPEKTAETLKGGWMHTEDGG